MFERCALFWWNCRGKYKTKKFPLKFFYELFLFHAAVERSHSINAILLISVGKRCKNIVCCSDRNHNTILQTKKFCTSFCIYLAVNATSFIRNKQKLISTIIKCLESGNASSKWITFHKRQFRFFFYSVFFRLNAFP